MMIIKFPVMLQSPNVILDYNYLLKNPNIWFFFFF